MTSRHRKTRPTPRLWLMTDERVERSVLLSAAARLPKGQGGIILRHYRSDPAARRALFEALVSIARRRRLVLLLAGSSRQAAAWRADGWHGRDARRRARPMLCSAPAHDAREMRAAERAGADIIFLSPLFPTRSHPGGRTLGRIGFARLARATGVVVMALGGVNEAHRRSLGGIGAAGWGAIDGLTARRSARAMILS
ncbi:MAG: thiamine phosphate synthase [Sphingobium sp.]